MKIAATRRFRMGFTLIELLVVIAILCLLIAILTPSLNRAKYLAKLTVCAANLHHIVVTISCYASDNGGRYPVAPANAPKPTYFLCRPVGSPVDVRPSLQPYANLRGKHSVFHDPFETSPGDYFSDDGWNRECDYNIYFGWLLNRFSSTGNLMRMDDLMVYTNAATGMTYRFDVLAGDLDLTVNFSFCDTTNGHSESSHPDMGTGRLNNVHDLCFDRYWSNGPQRGPVDLNFARTDGSVRRYTSLLRDDPRLTLIPGFILYSEDARPPLPRTMLPSKNQ